MRAAQTGDERAYSTLLHELLPVLRRIVGRRAGQAQDVEDIVQEVLISLHSVRQTFDPSRPFVPWLLAICSRRIIDAGRSRRRRELNETTVATMPETLPGSQTNSGASGPHEGEDLELALQELSPGHREAIELLKVQGLSLQEASTVTGRSIASLKVAVYRAIRALRSRLERKG